MAEGNPGTENEKEMILCNSVGEAEGVRGLTGHYRSHKGFWYLA